MAVHVNSFGYMEPFATTHSQDPSFVRKQHNAPTSVLGKANNYTQMQMARPEFKGTVEVSFCVVFTVRLCRHG